MTLAPDKPDAEAATSRSSLSRAFSSGMVWNSAAFIGTQSAGFVVFLILAMRLPPEIFGVVALASFVAEVVNFDGRYACMDAILQSRRFDKTSLNSAFYSFLGVALLFALGLCIAAPFTGAIYDSPMITVFMPLFGLMLLPMPWIAVMDALMTRDLAFKALSQRSIWGTLAGGVVGIAVAFSPWAIWALVAQRLSGLLATAFYEYRYTRWLPGFSVSWPAARDFLGRLTPLWLVSALSLVVSRTLIPVFGLRYDEYTVGLLRAANRISETVQGPLVSPLWGLWFPLMGKLQDDRDGERHVYNSIIRTAALLVLPAFAGVAIVADEVVHLMLPEQYAGVAPLLQAVAMAGLIAPLAWFNALAMASLGMNRVSLIYTSVVTTASLAALFASTTTSAPQTILIAAAPSLALSFVGNFIINRRLRQRQRDHYLGLAPAFLATAAMVAAILGVRQLIPADQEVLRLVTSVLTGCIVYCAWLFLFHRKWIYERLQLLGMSRDPKQAQADASDPASVAAADAAG